MSSPTPRSVKTFVRVRVPQGYDPADFAVKLENGIRYLLQYGGFGVSDLEEDFISNQDDYYMDHPEELDDEGRRRLDMLREEYVEKPEPR